MTVQDTHSPRLRLDEALVARGFFESRSRSRDAVLRGTVRVDGAVERKPSRKVSADSGISIEDTGQRYVSRAALKLLAGLEASGFDVSGGTCLDIGASTGGFSQVLLERGAAHVIALDVGHGQLHASLRDEPRVSVLEKLNARDLEADHLNGHAITMVVSDVSFISLKLALPPALALAEGGARGVFLVKPQFEVGRAHIGKGGLVTPELGRQAADDLCAWLGTQPGWRAHGLVTAPISGGDGNQEYLLWGSKTA